MTEVAANLAPPNVAPPAVKTKSDSANGSVVPPGEKPAKAKREPKPKAEATGEKKPRNVISFPKNATITVPVPEKEVKFRGKRAEYYDTLKANDGKTVEDLLTAFKNKNDEKGGGPGAWLRWFYDEGLVTVNPVAE